MEISNYNESKLMEAEIDATQPEVAEAEASLGEGNLATQSETDKAEAVAEDLKNAADSNTQSESLNVPKLTVRYNHRDVELTLDEAKIYAQKGMKYDSIIAPENKLGEQGKSNDTTDNSDLAGTIADGFLKLKEEFKEVSSFESLPESVRQDALNGGDIVKSYLLYCHRQASEIAQNKECQAAASKSSTGKLSESSSDTLYDSFLRGLYT